jgi:hypothetical protein
VTAAPTSVTAAPPAAVAAPTSVTAASTAVTAASMTGRDDMGDRPRLRRSGIGCSRRRRGDSDRGSPLRPPTTSHWFGAGVRRCQVSDPTFPRVTVHEMRHTAASLLIQSGANVKTVQLQLGHKTATMTLDQYGHMFDDDLDEVADKMDDIVAEGRCAQNVPSSLRFGE